MDVTVVGTMRLDRIGLPKGIKEVNGRGEKSTLYMHSEDKNMMLVSYIDRKKSGLKNAVVLTTMHDEVMVIRDQRKKPNVHSFYDHTKGGVDIVGYLSTSHSTRVKSKRCTLNCLALILDTLRTNAKAILGDNGVKLSNFEMTYQLGKALVLPSVERRYQNSNDLRMNILQKIPGVLGIELVNRRPSAQELVGVEDGNLPAKGRCHKCVKAIPKNSPMYKQERKKLNNKLKVKCVGCELFLCKDHTVPVYSSCTKM